LQKHTSAQSSKLILTRYFLSLNQAPPSSIYTQVHHRRNFTFDDIQQDRTTERIQWQADLTIKLCTMYSHADREVSRTLALEVKTGQYA
jgi:hypothetical protein